MSRTIEEIIALLEADLADIPRNNAYDEGFAAGVTQTLILLKHATKPNKKGGENEQNTLEVDR